MKKIRVFVLFALALYLPSSISHAQPTNTYSELIWHWESKFSEKEKQKLQTWITRVHDAITKRFGQYPFPIHIYFHKARWASEPVPWANTVRTAKQGVHFHVDSDASLGELLNDWTASHELSHLLIPYLGRSNMWFAEGFASYMQYKIMVDTGVLHQKQKWRKYASHLKKAEARYTYDRLPFLIASKQLAAERNFPTLYWGGAAYFINAEYQLLVEGIDIDTLLKKYLSCCRLKTRNLEDLISSFDALAQSPTFQSNYLFIEKALGFPEYQTALTFLASEDAKHLRK